MKAAIIDDEKHCIESLEILINELFPRMDIVYRTDRVHKAVRTLHQLNLDLLFLDIEMPGMNGFQLLEHFPNREFDVIFTTAYSEYALQAFKIKAVNYLLKPIDEDDLKDVVIHWKKHRKGNIAEQQKKIEGLLEYLKKGGLMKSKISVPVSDGYEFVAVNEVMYCRGRSNYSSLFLSNGEEMLVSKTLKIIENALDKFYFIRVHQSYLINPDYMKKFSRKDGGYVLMKNEKIIPISRSKRNLVVGLFEAVRRNKK